MTRPLTSLALVLLLLCGSARGQFTERSPNFVITAANQELAKNVSYWCERHYDQLWRDWFGTEPKQMPAPAPIEIIADTKNYGSTGLFVVDGQFIGANGRWHFAAGWGADTCPHEVMHIVFTHALQWNAPRWIEEGVAVSCEDASGQSPWFSSAQQSINRRSVMPLRQLNEHSPDMPEFTHYRQGATLVAMLLEKEGGRRRFIEFVKALQSGGLDYACSSVYGMTPEQIDSEWASWVMQHPADETNQRIIGRVACQFNRSGNCWSCSGSECSTCPSDGWQPAGNQVVTQPVQPSKPARTDAEIRADWKAYIEAQITAKLEGVKGCECDHSQDVTREEFESLSQQVTVLSQSTAKLAENVQAIASANATINQTIEGMQPYIPPTPEQQATAILPHLPALRLELKRPDGTTQLQERRLGGNLPLQIETKSLINK